jgi:hypothetical protein
MDTLHDALFRVILENFTFESIAADVLVQQLRAQGIADAERFRTELETQLKSLAAGSVVLSLDLPDGANLHLSLEESELEATYSQRLKSISQIVPEAIAEGAPEILAELMKRAPAMHREQAQIRRGFELRLRKLWRRPLDLLEMLIVISRETGSDFNTEFRPDAVRTSDFVFEALTHNHARACQVASEVLCLLRSGFADGAHARWRTLHELAVTSCFLCQRGQEVAERYLLHEHVEAYRGALQYRRYTQRVGVDSIDDAEFAQLRARRDQLVARFGRPYGKDNGWAAEVLASQPPTFADIERSTDLHHWRPHYKLASHNVHSGPTGIRSRLGLLQPGTLLAGPSNAGLAEPGHATALSLALLTIHLLNLRPNVDRLTADRIFIMLADEIGAAFAAVHTSQAQCTPRRTGRSPQPRATRRCLHRRDRHRRPTPPPSSEEPIDTLSDGPAEPL